MAEMSSKTSKKVLAGTAAAGAKPAAKKVAVAKAPSAVKPAAKSAAKPTAKKTAVGVPVEAGAVKAVASKRVKQEAGKVMTISDEQRYRMVAEAAYYRAETNHFKSDPLRDWIEAESDIAALLSGVK